MLNLKVSEQRGQRIVALSPDVLTGSQAELLRAQVARIVTEEKGGLIVDCRQLPAGAVDRIAPLLHEWLILGRQQTPRVDVCAVGRTDQSTGDSSVLAMAPRFQTLDAALAFLNARGNDNAVAYHRAAGVSETLVEGESERATVWSVIGRYAVVAVMLAFSASMVVYSIKENFMTAPKYRGRVQTILRSAGRARVAVYGTVRLVEANLQREDASAVLLLWPVATPVEKFQVQRSELQSGQVRKLPLYVQGTDIEGRYAFMHSSLAEDDGTRYHLLAISRDSRRAAPIDEAGLALLSTYFLAPAELLSESNYRLAAINLVSFDAVEQNFVLAAPTIAAPPPSSATASPAP